MTTPTKFVLSMIVLALSLFVIPAISAQEAITAGAYDIIATNVRSGPGQAYTVIGVINPGFEVDVTGRTNFEAGRVCYSVFSGLTDMWLRVDFNGIEGWVARCAVDVEGNVDSLAVADPANPRLVADLEYLPSTQSNAYFPAPDTDHVIGWTLAPVNMRDGASLGSNILLIAPATEDLYVIGRTDDSRWLQVQYQGQTGWIARYLILLPNDWTETVPVQ